ncbi:ferredoxin [Amycolatopsis thermoflava]|uniref:ferredoxin n=1 Tax=Amycolatopsis thermoflava TaxID=84480 RepID=UPI003816AD47
MKISVNREACTGHAQCNAVAPEAAYDLDDDGYCAIDVVDVEPGLGEQARQGAGACPERAITVTGS